MFANKLGKNAVLFRPCNSTVLLCCQVFDLDVSRQLQSYEVEYHVLKEEMMFSPSANDTDALSRLEIANQTLKQQNMELIEKLQHAQSHERSLEIMIHNYQTQEAKLKSHIRTLELERQALLNAVAKLKQLVPEEAVRSLEINLPTLTPSMPVSPVHHGRMVGHDGIAITENLAQSQKNSQSEQPAENGVLGSRQSFPKSARFRPDRQS